MAKVQVLLKKSKVIDGSVYLPGDIAEVSSDAAKELESQGDGEILSEPKKAKPAAAPEKTAKGKE